MNKDQKINVFVVGYGVGYAKFLENYSIVNDLEDADVVIFTGGEDVNPALYGAKVHKTTYFTKRDEYEVIMYKKCLKHKNIKLIIGICRGAQLGCVMNGGLLIQDVLNHGLGGGHDIIMNNTGEIFNISSLHHQMLYPFNLPQEKYEILAFAYPARSHHYSGDLIEKSKVVVEPEIVIFNGDKKLLAIQGHPEMMNKNSRAVQIINELIWKLI